MMTRSPGDVGSAGATGFASLCVRLLVMITMLAVPVALLGCSSDDSGNATPADAGGNAIAVEGSTQADGGVGHDGSASVNNVYADANVADVEAAARILIAVQLTPVTPTIHIGETQAYVATAQYSDGSDEDVTATAMWSTSDATIATINSVGLATGVATGTVQITATVSTGPGAPKSGSAGLVVSPAALISLSIAPSTPAPTVGAGYTVQFTAMATYADGTTSNATSLSTWTSSNPSVATISTLGLASGVALGTCTIAATFGGMTATMTLTVSSAAVVAVSVTPNPATTNVGGAPVQFSAMGTFSDGTTGDITGLVTWSSSDGTKATIDSASGLAQPVAAGTVTITAARGTVTGNAVLIVGAGTLTGITVTPPSASLPVGTTEQFAATAQYSDGTTQDVTSSASWQSSNPSTATITALGLATSIASGSSTITAMFGGKSGSATLTVSTATLASISVTPNPGVTNVGGAAVQFAAMGGFSDRTTRDITTLVTWSSSDTTKATVGVSTGRAQPVAAGTVSITATSGTVKGTAVLTVGSGTLTGLTVTPPTATIAAGTTEQFTVMAQYSDGSSLNVTSSASWVSSNTTIASLSTLGVATGVASGTSNITAAFGGKTSAASVLTVSTGRLVTISVTPNPGKTNVGGAAVQFTATGAYSDNTSGDITSQATWSTSDSTKATIKTGLAYPVAAGTVTVTAAIGTVTGTAILVVGSATITGLTVTPPTLTIAAGTTAQFSAVAQYSDGSTQNVTSLASWQSSTTTTATISPLGVATALAAGSTNITATFGGLTSASATLTVSSATLVAISLAPNPGKTNVGGVAVQFTARGAFSDSTSRDISSQVTWSTSDPTKATITAGLAYPVAAGTVTITAASGTISGTSVLVVGSATLTGLAVNPPSATIPAGTTQQFTATAQYSDGSTQNVTSSASWVSSSTTTATISSAGVATAVIAGSTSIKATFGGLTSTAVPLTVSSAKLVSIGVAPNPGKTNVGGAPIQYSALGAFSDHTSQDITGQVSWSTSDPTVATVDSTALAHPVGAGTVTITAMSGTGSAAITGTATLVVGSAVITSVTVTPSAPTIPAGTTQQFTAIARYSDGSSQDVSSAASWIASLSLAAPATTVVTISPEGLATGVSAGTSNITAQFAGMTSPAVLLTVTNATLVSIGVTPNPGKTNVGGSSVAFAATGTFSDNTTRSITGLVNWSTSDPRVTITQAGVATPPTSASGAGTFTITATVVAGGSIPVSGTVTGTAVIVVGSATLTSVTVSPTTQQAPTVPVGLTRQFTATAHYSDGTTQDVTSSASWQSATPATATVSTSPQANPGQATGIAVGSSNITATFGGLASTASTLTVSSATLVSISVTPLPATAYVGGAPVQFDARGSFSDGTSSDITSSVTWSTSDATKATVNGQGLASPVAAGQVNVLATVLAGGVIPVTGTVTGTAALNVLTATVTRVVVTPPAASIPVGASQQFAATAYYSDGHTQDVTSSPSCSWVSTNTANASVSQVGLAAGLLAGSTGIKATFSGQTSASAALTVTSATLVSISVTPNPTNAYVGGAAVQFTATGTYSDTTHQNITNQVTWSVPASQTTATISATTGLAYPGTAGTVVITASSGAVSGTATLTVSAATVTSIVVTPPSAVIAAGTTAQFKATAHYSDGTSGDVTSSASWGAVPVPASGPTNATLSSATPGLASGVVGGTSTITGSFGGQTGTATLTVTQVTLVSIAVTPNPSSAYVGGANVQFTATGTYSDTTHQNITNQVTWSVPASQTTATISPTTGLAYLGTAGTVVITASSAAVSGTATLTVSAATVTTIVVTPPSAVIAAGTTVQFKATAHYSDGTSGDVTSSASWGAVPVPATAATSATLSSATPGLASGVVGGTSTITASFGGQMGTSTLNVTQVTLVSIAVTPNPSSAYVGGANVQFTATGTYSDTTHQNITNQVTWSVPAGQTTATIGPTTGLAYPGTAGTVVITASSGAVSGTATLTVSPATVTSIVLTPPSAVIAAGTTEQFKATAHYSDGTNGDVTSSASWGAVPVPATAPTSVTLSSATPGLSSGIVGGTSTITASFGGQSGTATLTVTQVTLVGIAVTPNPGNAYAGGANVQFYATGTYSDTTHQDITNQVTWSVTSGQASATINPTTGLAYPGVAGTATIVASLGTVSGTTTLNVQVPSVTLVSVAVAPAAPANLPKGLTQQFTASAKFSDGSTADVTTSASWTSSIGTVASISPIGLATGLAVGSTNITATWEGVPSAQVLLTVTPAVLESIVITALGPTTLTLASADNVTFDAVGTYSDATSADITAQVTWVATTAGSPSPCVTWSGPSNNVATAAALGTCVVSASVSGSAATSNPVAITVQ